MQRRFLAYVSLPLALLLAACTIFGNQPTDELKAAADQDGPGGTNCDLVAPPQAAGETYLSIGTHTQVAKVFPRLSDIGPDYTGCQVAWMSSTPDFTNVKVLRIQIRQGKAIAIWPPPAPYEPLCAKGESAKATGCQYPAHYLAASAFPGCASEAKHDNQMPKNCLTELFREMDLRERHIERAEPENAP